MYVALPNELMDQGDIIKKVEILFPVNDEPTSELQVTLATVITLSHGCEIDKGRNTLLVTPIFRLEPENIGLNGQIRKGKVSNAFYLNPDGPMTAEATVDWRYVQIVRKAPVASNRIGPDYMCSLDADAKLAMAESFVRFFFRS